MKMHLMAAAMAAGLLMAGGTASAANLITNGDFSAGNTGFTSGYTYVAPDNGNLGDKSGSVGEGKYTVASNPILQNSYFVALNDGNQRLIVNGATSGAPIVFNSTSLVSQTGAYNFSADVIDICCNASHNGQTDAPSTITFQYALNGSATYTNLASFTTNGTPGATVSLTGGFSANNGDTLMLRIINGNNALSGNDFAIDNVSVTAAAPEPATWAFMFMGVGMAGAALRRRRSTAVTSLAA